MDKIPQEVLNRLDALAAKLGTTVQYLWEILVAQARIEAWADTGYALASAVVLFFLIRTILRTLRIDRSYKSSFPEARDWTTSEIAYFWVSLMVCIPASITLSCCAYGAFVEFLNPQFWALQTLMKMLHG